MMVSDEEISYLVDDIYSIYGYDFGNYSAASFRRRIERLILLDKFTSFSEFRYIIQTDKAYFKRFVEEVTVNLTEMFRDPYFFKDLRELVFPEIATKPFIRIWHAGCSTGEEVYSTAILLKDMNLLDKSLLYATDINPSVIEIAKRGSYPLGAMKKHSENYIASGGREDFSRYYTTSYSQAIFNRELTQRMIFSTHNLVTDRSFNEFDLIICRNVLIYFEKELQNRVLNLFSESLSPLGFLALGTKESIYFNDISKEYVQLSKHKIWQKINPH